MQQLHNFVFFFASFCCSLNERAQLEHLINSRFCFEDYFAGDTGPKSKSKWQRHSKLFTYFTITLNIPSKIYRIFAVQLQRTVTCWLYHWCFWYFFWTVIGSWSYLKCVYLALVNDLLIPLHLLKKIIIKHILWYFMQNLIIVDSFFICACFECMIDLLKISIIRKM